MGVSMNFRIHDTLDDWDYTIEFVCKKIVDLQTAYHLGATVFHIIDKETEYSGPWVSQEDAQRFLDSLKEFIIEKIRGEIVKDIIFIVHPKKETEND